MPIYCAVEWLSTPVATHGLFGVLSLDTSANLNQSICVFITLFFLAVFLMSVEGNWIRVFKKVHTDLHLLIDMRNSGIYLTAHCTS